MYIVYIIQSEVDKTHYIGHAENVKQRLKQHNAGRVHSTKSKRPWKIVYAERYDTKSEAYNRELQIKAYKGGEAFKRLIKK